MGSASFAATRGFSGRTSRSPGRIRTTRLARGRGRRRSWHLPNSPSSQISVVGRRMGVAASCKSMWWCQKLGRRS